jgi:hypothetical protein
MIANALLVAAVVWLALGFVVMQECRFLIPYRHLAFQKYGPDILLFSATLFVNLFAGAYLTCRRLFLKDTGRKLAHLERQLRTGAGVSEELAGHLED